MSKENTSSAPRRLTILLAALVLSVGVASAQDSGNGQNTAPNVKIITQNGHVTLAGPVRSDEEKNSVEAKAAELAGATNVTNQLEVAAGK